MRAAFYARVSTDMQAEEGKSIAAQLTEMRELAEKRGWQPVGEFIDLGYGGGDMDRPELQRMLDVAEAKGFDVLVVHELSRLSRSLHDTLLIFERLGKLGIGFVSVKEPNFDFSTPSGRLFLSILAALNQYYLEILRQHTAKSKHQRAREGLYNSSIPPYGYRHVGDKDTPPEIDPREAPAVRMMFEEYASGNYSYQQIADMVSDAGYRTRAGRRFSKDTVADILRNRFYTGKVVYHKKHRGEPPEVYQGQHEAIIDEALYEACRQVREQRHRSPSTFQRGRQAYLLNGIACCDVCGRKLRAQSQGTHRYYREMSRSRGFDDCPSAQVGVRVDSVDEQVGRIFRLLTLPPDWQAELERMLDREDERDRLRNARQRLLGEQRRLRQLYIKGYFGNEIGAFEREYNRIQRELDALPIDDLPAIQQAARTLKRLSEVWDNADLEDRRDLIRLALREVRIDVTQGRVMALVPWPPFIPLLRQVEALLEIETGVFIPLWPPEVASEMGPDPVLDPILKPPEMWTDWPFIAALPYEASRRITPTLSDFLKARRKAGQPVQVIVDVLHPPFPRLRVDRRKWDVSIEFINLPQIKPALPYENSTVSFLSTPFRLQRSADKRAWVEEAARVLEPGGWWIFTDVMPHSMLGHWLYQYFPKARDFDLGKTLDPSALYLELGRAGFQVRMSRQVYYQAVSVGAACDIAEQRSGIPQLAALPDEVYRAGYGNLMDLRDRRGREELLASQICTVQVVARKIQ